MLTHWVLIVFLYSSADVIASTKTMAFPVDYGAVFSTKDACDAWANEKLSDIKRIESFVCIPRPAYRN
jgi:hypothetical protein